MFLHAQRLVLPNDLESLDVSTEDPFISPYNEDKVIHELQKSTYDIFDDETLNWFHVDRKFFELDSL